MDTGNQNQGIVTKHLRKQLAASVRSIQWSYSIFWSISPTDPGVLEWGEGYYNGDIKTRKTTQAEEWDVDEMSLKRSEQLRELFEFLLVGETTPQARRPSAALSPEDLSDTEWYYLVCMSFVFNLGQGLPGSTLESGKPIWLCNADQADSRVFSRSLLAKSASVQTVVCFPLLGGVVELGVTDLVLEDHSLIQNVQASLLGAYCPALSERPSSVTPHHSETILDNAFTEIVQDEELRMLESPDNSFGLIQPLEETKSMTEVVNGDLADDELSNCFYTSSDCISHNLGCLEDPISLSMLENVDEIHPRVQEKTDVQCVDDLHYKNVLGSIFKTTHRLIWEPSIHGYSKDSCFVSWKKGVVDSYHNPRRGNSQRILKKILFGVPWMYGATSSEHKVDSETKDTLCSPEDEELASSRVLAERRRRERVNGRFCALKSLIPSIHKVDKVSILDDTIKYMKELERRVEELEGCQDMTGMKPQDTSERTSENYRNTKVGVKRKAGDAVDEGKREDTILSLRDSFTNTNLCISLIQKEITIEITCPWKECLLLEIIDALTNLRLDTHSVQSSTSNSFLSLTIKAKIKGSGGLSAGTIRQVLQRVLIRSG